MSALHRPWRMLWILVCLPLWSSCAWAWGNDLALPAPAPVVDEFGLLAADQQAELARILANAKAASGIEIAIFIPSSLRGREIEDFGIAVADQWKLGRKKEDKGLLLLIAPKERKMRLEVGYGLEGDLTDAFSRRVLDNVLRPYFREGRYFDGILASLLAIQEKVPLGLDQQAAPKLGRRAKQMPLLLVLFFVIFLPLMILMRVLQALGIVRRPSSSSHSWGGGGWGGGGFGGGGGGGSSWGGGGGGFGGGGASSNW